MSWSSAVKKVVKPIEAGVFCRPSVPLHKPDISRLVTLDFETYFDDDYTLRKMSTSEYIRDPRFKAQMVGIKIGKKATKYYSAARVFFALKSIDWNSHDLLCHNTAFDGLILSHHYGIVPRRYYDTLSMARGLHSNDIGAGLDEVAQYYGVGNKIPDVLERTRGVQGWDKQLDKDAGAYCTQDVELTYTIFNKMLEVYPDAEIRLIHLIISMFCNPVLKVDIPRVQAEYDREVTRRKALLLNAVDLSKYDPNTLLKGKERLLEGEERELLMAKRVIGSNEKFADLLRQHKVEPPVKISPAWIKKKRDERRDEDKWVYAFAKDDAEFISLAERVEEWTPDLDQNNPADLPEIVDRQECIQALIDARLVVKSTTNITRAARFIEAGKNGMSLPAGYAYYRAHCLTGDSEVLTPNGWQRLDAWDGGKIMQWHKDGRLEYINAIPNVFNISEDIACVDSHYHSANYTLGHNVPTVTARGKFHKKQAIDLLSTRYDIPISGLHDGAFSISVTDAQIAVMVQADGNVRPKGRSGRCVRLGFKKQRKIERCTELLDAAEVRYTKRTDAKGMTHFYIGSAEADKVAKYLGEGKTFKHELLQSPLEVKRAFIDELSHWDGDIEPHNLGFTYTTTNKANAEFVHTLAHLSGQSAYISVRNREDKGWSTAYRVYFRHHIKTRTHPSYYQVKHFEGKVYCPTTKTGFFLMRHNGKIVITGNTGRLGGNNKMNMQNLTRGGELRLSIMAPKGYVLDVGDSGQIECRVNGWLWGQDDLISAFKDADAGIGRDAYCNFASIIYGREITKADKDERFVGKVCVLGLGFMMGASKLQMTFAKGALGGPKIFFSLERCKDIVNTYRRKNYRIVEGWDICKQIIEDMAAGRTGSHKCISWEKETIWLPNGMALKYPDLRKSRNDETGWDEWSYQSKDMRKKIYGGLLCENIVQALARIIVMDQMLEVSTKYRPVMTTHDEIVTLVKKRSAAVADRFLNKIMRTPPAWCADLPLNSEGGYAENYSK